MARRAKPNLFPELWMTTGGRRQVTLRDRSRLGEESREEGLEERDREDLGLVGGPAESSGEEGGNQHETSTCKYRRSYFQFIIIHG